LAIHEARCANCLKPLTIQVQVDLSEIEQLINRRFDRLEQLLGVAVANIDDELTTLEADVKGLSDDETRELADLEALKAAGQALTPEQQARFDALDAKVKADTSAIDQADPPPAAPAAPVEPPPAA